MNIIKQFFNTGEGQSVLDKLSFVFLFLSIFLLPFFIFPSSIFIFSFSKSAILFIGVILSFIFWLMARLKEGTFELPKNIIFIFAMIVPFVYLLSSLFSGSISASLFGRGFELDTFSSITALFLLFVLIPVLFKSNKRITYLYLSLFTSAIIISLYQILRLIFGPNFLSLGVIFSPTSNLIGSWNDMAVFFGLMSILSLSTLELIKTSNLMKVFIYAILVVSLFFLWIINFTTVWTIIGLFALIFFIYTALFKAKRFVENEDTNINREENLSVNSVDTEKKRRLSLTSLAIFIVSLIFVISGGLFTETTNSLFGTSYIEARPSWGATFELAGKTIKESPILGVGPNRFSSQWLIHKPSGINNTIFWNTNFNSGIGFVPSTLVTTGILGLLSWIAFIGMFLFLAFKRILGSTEDPLTRFIAMSSFLVSIYLWIFTILYVPNLTLMALAMIFSGIFVAYLYKEGVIKTSKISFSVNPRIGFIAISVIVILLVASVSWGIVETKKFIASTYFQQGLIEFNIKGNLNASLDKISKATNIDGNDLYYSNLSQLNIIELNRVLTQENVSDEILREQFLTKLGIAIDNAQKATKADGTNFQNWMALGKVYEAVIPIKIEGAYEGALASYQKALELNPESPAILLTMARLELINKDNEKAREFIASALQKKNNYTEAVFLLSQIEISEGNITQAIKSVETAATIAPNDSTIFFQLGLLNYNNKNNKKAITALERAVLLSPTYSNAKYFLGLAYYKAGRTSDAIKQFEEIKVLNPNNIEVEKILNNLKEGKDPLVSSNKTSNSKEIKDLPIEE